jgi:hypothetical protein
MSLDIFAVLIRRFRRLINIQVLSPVRTSSSSTAFLAAWFAIAFPAHAQTDGVPLPLKRTTDCMFAVLKTMPGVSEPRMGIATNNGWTHSFLEYRAAERSSEEQPIRFDAKKSDHDGYWFLAVRSGMGEVDLHVTEVVIAKWKTQCGVDASVLLP